MNSKEVKVSVFELISTFELCKSSVKKSPTNRRMAIIIRALAFENNSKGFA
jgi:hypothetical protein